MELEWEWGWNRDGIGWYGMEIGSCYVMDHAVSFIHEVTYI